MKLAPLVLAPLSLLLFSLASIARAQDAQGAPPAPTSSTAAKPSASDDAMPEPSPPAHVVRFGDAKQLVFSSESTLGASYTTFADGSPSASSAGLDVSADYFVAPQLSVGLELAYQTRSTSLSSGFGETVRESSKTFGFGARVGYVFPFSDRLSLWPRVGLTYAQATTEGGDPAPPSLVGTGFEMSYASSVSEWFVTASAPLIFTPAPRFFLGFGPSITALLSSSQGNQASSTEYGATLILGGYLGGESRSEPATAADAPERFGDQGTFVLSSDVVVSATHASDSAGGSSTLVEVSPAFDYFVGKGFSIGVVPSFTHGTPYSDANTFGLGARVGANLPLGDVVSIWLRGALGAASTSDNGATTTYSWVTVDAPILAHVAPHLFAGFGPSLYHELLRSDDDFGPVSAATTIGGSLIVGGWL